MAKYRIAYIVAVTALAMLYIFCDSYMPLVILLLAVILPFFTVISAAFCVKRLSVKVAPMLASVICGEDMTFNVTIENLSKLPFSVINLKLEYVDISEGIPLRRKIRTAVGAGEKKSILISAVTQHCAVVECRIKKARCCDALGLFSFKIKNIKDTAQIVVIPQLIKGGLKMDSEALNDSDSDNYSDTQKGDDPSQVFEIRDYAPGDDIRRIHWRLSSKQDRIIVKEFSQPVADECVVLLETGLKGGSIDEFKVRVDNVLSAFLTLADNAFNSERSMSVRWYSQDIADVLFFEITSCDDVYAVVREFLTEVFSSETNISLKYSQAYMTEQNNSFFYYIYDSSHSDADLIGKERSGLLVPIAADKAAALFRG